MWNKIKKWFHNTFEQKPVQYRLVRETQIDGVVFFYTERRHVWLAVSGTGSTNYNAAQEAYHNCVNTGSPLRREVILESGG